MEAAVLRSPEAHPLSGGEAAVDYSAIPVTEKVTPPSPSSSCPDQDRPTFRGVSHLWSAFISVPLGVLLVLSSPTPGLRPVLALYAFATVGLFSFSAALHTVRWSRRWYHWAKRADHAMIFVFIASSYTALLTPLLSEIAPTRSQEMVLIAWALAAAGVVSKLVWIGAPKWVSALAYVGTGWAGISCLPVLWGSGHGIAALLILAGGILFTIGAVIYAFKLSNPIPGVFEYHEVFHIFIILGVATHWCCLIFCVLPQVSSL